MRKICLLLIILMLAGSQGAWGAKTPPDIQGTWQGPQHIIYESSGTWDGTMVLIVNRQVGSFFLGRITWPDYTGPDYLIAGTIDTKGNIRINGGVLENAPGNHSLKTLELTAKLSHKSGVLTITGDWREVDYPIGASTQAPVYLTTYELTKQ